MKELEKALILRASQNYSQIELAALLADKRKIPLGNAQPILSRYFNGQSRAKKTTSDLLEILDIKQVMIDLKANICELV